MQSCNYQGKSHSSTYIILVIAALWLIVTAPVVAEINGAAVYEDYGQEQYIAVLRLAETTANSEQAIQQSNQVGAVMEFVVLAESISSRRMSRHWRESVLVNVERPVIEANSEALASLSALLKGPLKRGDKLSIARRSGGVDVSLNQTPIGTLDAPKLLSVMIHSWIGPVPPSSAFRAAILGDGEWPTDLVGRYQNISVAAHRQSEIEQLWLAPEGELKDAQSPTIAEAGAEVQAAPVQLAAATGAALVNVGHGLAVATDARPPLVTTLVQSTTANLPALDSQVSGQASTGVTSVAGADTASLPAEPFVDPVFSTSEEQLQDQLVLAPSESVAATELAVLDTQLASLGSGQGLPEELLLSSKMYYEEIKRKIYQRVKYPAIALRRGNESEVTLNVQIDPAGKLLAVEVSDGSQFKYFNKAATKAVKSASPFGPPPEESIDSGVYELKMQVNFRIDA